MKVGIVAPLSIAVVNGGIRTQASKTAEYLAKAGVDCTLLSPWTSVEKADLDVVHVFSSGTETHEFILLAKKKGIKVVLSPVFFSTRSSFAIKSAIRFESLLKRISPGLRLDFGIKKRSCELADLVLPNTSEELELIRDGLQIREEILSVIPNGVESRFANASPDLFVKKYGLKDFVLFTGQTDAPRKNVLRLINAAKDIDTNIVIIGSLSDSGYCNKIRAISEASPNIYLIETLEHDSELLASAYAAAHTFVLPSFYETPGIAALEAALAGANIVITKHGGTKDYFGNDGIYIDPYSSKSIREGILKSLERKPDDALKNSIISGFTWEQVAAKTLEQYKRAL